MGGGVIRRVCTRKVSTDREAVKMASEQSRGGINVRDVASSDFVIAYAAHLKRIGKIEVPKWADLVKTASFKELGPYDPDWYYIRAGVPALCWRRPPGRVGRVCCASPLITRARAPPLPSPLRAPDFSPCLCHPRAAQLPSLVVSTCGVALGWARSRRSSAGVRCAARATRSSPRALDRSPGMRSSSSSCSRSSRRCRMARGACSFPPSPSPPRPTAPPLASE